MEQHSKIPIPFAQRWKEFRIKILPGLIFLSVSLVVFNLWNHRVTSANMTGIVIGVQAEIRSAQGGYLTQIQASRFQNVSAGDPIAEVVTTDPKILEARLAVVLAEVEMIRLGMGPVENRQRNLLNLEGMQMDMMKQRIDLASAGLYRQRAEREFERVSSLYNNNLISEDEYEKAKSELDIITLEIEQKTEMLETMHLRIENLNMEELEENIPHGNPVQAAIRLQEERLRLIEAELMPITLYAPIDGMISRVFRSGGEQIEGGETIMMIQSPNPDYIVGYLPHPVRMEPEVGMPVTVRSQSNSKMEFEAFVTNVGVQVEDMSEVQRMPVQMAQAGLSVKISLADEVYLRPGEIVDLTLKPN